MVTIKLLARDQKSKLQFKLYRLGRGTQLPAHQHTDFEYVFVFTGELRDEFGKYPRGTFKVNPKGSIHSSYSPGGCTLLVIGRGKHRLIKKSHEKTKPKSKK